MFKARTTFKCRRLFITNLETDRVAPEVVSERGELVDAPLVPGPAG